MDTDNNFKLTRMRRLIIVGNKGKEKPNIIFILTDDLGYCDLECYGQEKIETPNIDKFASEGMRFTQCYAGASVCAPSRSVLMTGQHTGHTRIRGNFGIVGGTLVLDNGSLQRRVSLKSEDITIAEVLKDAGYTTGITGKWGLAEPNTPGIPNQKSFDEWFGYLNQRRAHTYYPPYLWHNEEKVILERNKNGQRGQYSHSLFAQYAIEFIKEHRNEPFFLYLPFTIPHGRFEVPDDAPYSDKLWSQEAKNFAAMVTLLDRDIGRIIDLLKKLEIDENTVVFFCSDNGAGPRFEELFGSTGSFRGYKGSLYEGGIRIPMIVRWPGKISAGEVSDKVWYFADFLPTAVEIAGAENPSNIDGISILPILLGEEQVLEERFLYWEQFGFEQSVRFGDWKAIRKGIDGTIQLYNLENDVSEQNDVSEKHPEVIEKIKEYLKNARTDSENWPVKLRGRK